MGLLQDREEDDNACCVEEDVAENTTDYMKFVCRKPGLPGFLSSSEAKHPVYEYVTTFISPFGGRAPLSSTDNTGCCADTCGAAVAANF